jgi:hypothetical protein
MVDGKPKCSEPAVLRDRHGQDRSKRSDARGDRAVQEKRCTKPGSRQWSSAPTRSVFRSARNKSLRRYSTLVFRCYRRDRESKQAGVGPLIGVTIGRTCEAQGQPLRGGKLR